MGQFRSFLAYIVFYFQESHLLLGTTRILVHTGESK